MKAQSPTPRTKLPRLRAYALGMGLIPLVCWWSLRTEIFSGGSELIEGSLLPIVVFVLFGLVLLNNGVRFLRPGLALTRSELLIVYVMQTTSVGLAGLGQIQFLNQALAGAYGQARPEDGWENLFHRYIPRWWTPDPAVLPDYYAGNSTLWTGEHLRGWAVPFVVWSGFIVVLLFSFLCLNTMLRRHWVENERMPFPLIQLPLELTHTQNAGSVMSRRTFWLAFAAACVFRSMSGLPRVEPRSPAPPLLGAKGQLIDLAPFFTDFPWNQIGYFRLSFHPIIIGITYFLPLDVSFSAWFFYLVTKGEMVFAAALGLRGSANAATAEIPYTAEQGAGAFLAIALISLWGARRHLQNVYRKAVSDAPDISDADEPLSYRTAFWGFLVSAAVLVGFVTLGGMAWYLGLLFFGLYFLMMVTVTRLRAEAGPMLGYGPTLTPHRMMVLIPGSHCWGAQDLTTFSYLNWFDSDYRTSAMPQQMEALKLTETQFGHARHLGRALWLAGTITVVFSFVCVVALYYHYGASTPRGDNGWRYANGRIPFQMLADWLKNPKPPDTIRLVWVGVGVVLTLALTAMRTAFLWWPLHPSGFALAHAGAAMQWVWSAMLLGWLVKALLLRYGGIALFRRGIPFFLGLIMGDVVISCVWSLLGVVLDVDTYMFFPG